MQTITRIAGRYELVDRIGSGGSGSVWRARDIELGRQVAVKLVPIGGDLTPEEQERSRARVTREARAAASLRHPSLVTVFDVVETPNQVAIVMAYVDAPNLRQLVARDGPLTDARAADIGIAIANALGVAHTSGIVHRDVKPSNVLAGVGDRVHLTDFGIATGTDETRLTRTGAVIGSPSYVAPEQARGEDPRPAVDVWGLGATLYFAVTAESPFERSSTLASLHAVLNDAPPVPDPPSELWPLIAQMLAKDPSQRPPLAEVVEGLRDPGSVPPPDGRHLTRTATMPLPTEGLAGAAGAAWDGQDDEARAASGSSRTGRRSRALLVAAAVLTLATLTVLGLARGGDTQQPDRAGTEQPATSEQEDADQPAEDDPSTDASPADGDQETTEEVPRADTAPADDRTGDAGGGAVSDPGPPPEAGPPSETGPPDHAGKGKPKGKGKGK